jgi:hypothetical protein
VDIEVLGVITNRAPTGAYRGAGGPEAAFSVERTVDLIARELGLDPVEVRRKNLIQPDAFPYHTPTGITYDSGDYEKVFDRALELADYAAWREQSRQGNQPDAPLIGVGLAAVTKGSGAHGERRTDHARVVIDASGRVSVYSGVSPHGQGTETTFTQIVADELDLTNKGQELFTRDTEIRLISVRNTLTHSLNQVTYWTENLRTMQDSLSDYLNREQTRSGNRLAAMASIMLLPTFLVGLYGMNIDSTYFPEFGWLNGYLLAWILIVVITVIQVVVFRRMGWLSRR